MTDHNTPTPRTDNTDHWRVDRDEADLTYRDVVSADFARDLERELAECRAALRELVAIDAMPGVVPMNAIHRYQCPCTRHGKSFGPCDCAGTAVDARIDLAWIAARKLTGDGK